MESLQDILGGRDFSPPDEITAVKEYIQRRYKSKSSVELKRETLFLTLPNSTLAATVRLEQNSLIDACHIKHRLVIRYGKIL